MISAYGDRQQHLLKLLLATKAGLTVESLSQQLDISRNAVRQHLASLELEGLVAKGVTHPTGGRPEQSYVLTPKGHELFPRKYSWFSELLIESLRDETSPEHLRQRFIEMGKRVGAQLPVMAGGPAERIKQMTNIMRDLGYESTMREGSGQAWPSIEATNCVFHHLASRFPDVCQFDLALLEQAVQRPVLHEECMVKGGTACRFKFQAGAQESLIQLRPRPHGDTKLQPSKKQAARKRS
jgi:predicted ArsR family transcriptional regulator